MNLHLSLKCFNTFSTFFLEYYLLFLHPSTLTRFPAKMMLPPPCFMKRLSFICCPWLVFTALIGKALIRRQHSSTIRMKHKHLQTVQDSYWCKVNLIADLLTCTHTCKTHAERHTHPNTQQPLLAVTVVNDQSLVMACCSLSDPF